MNGEPCSSLEPLYGLQSRNRPPVVQTNTNHPPYDGLFTTENYVPDHSMPSKGETIIYIYIHACML